MMENFIDNGTIQDIKNLVGNFESEFRRGMFTWLHQKKLAADPSYSVPLVSTLVSQLGKKMKKANEVHKVKAYSSIVPMLHMLHYVVLQAGTMIPSSLYQEVNKCLKELVKFPLPYSAVAINTLRSTTLEINTPGLLYWNKVLAEQNLNIENLNQHEKVFVFADPAVFSASMEETIKSYLKVSGFYRNTTNVQKQMIMHVLQAEAEQSQKANLAAALEALDEAAVKTFFKELNLAVSESSKCPLSKKYLDTRQRIYRDIMAASESGSSQVTDGDRGFLRSNTLPYPHFKFILCTKEEQFWNELGAFTLSSNSLCNDDEEDANTKRDSGIEKDLKELSLMETQASAQTNQNLQRRKAFKHQESKEKLRIVSKKIQGFQLLSPEKRWTARVVFMGDDRMLGKLSKAYRSLRERESKSNILTKKLNLELYYIPVTDDKSSVPSHNEPLPIGSKLSLASHLAGIDPWYRMNILSLGDAISTSLEAPSDSVQPSELQLYMLDSLCYYLRCGTQHINLPLYSVKITTEDSKVVDEVFVSHLHVNIPGSKPVQDTQQKKRLPNRRKSSSAPPGAIVSVSYRKRTTCQRDMESSSTLGAFGVDIKSNLAIPGSAQDSLLVDFDCLDQDYKGMQVRSITVETNEDWRFFLCLDRDSCRTYQQVRRIDVTPCLDPGCDIRTLHGTNGERLLSRHLNKLLSLPIHTFSGVSA